MAGGDASALRFQVTIHECRLLKIFDTLKQTQDVYVGLTRLLPNGKEGQIARTETCKGGNLNPKWDDERFVVCQAGGRSLVLRVFIEHFFRVDCLCGEAELAFETIRTSVAQGSNVTREVQIIKKGSPTGTIRVTVGRAAAAPPLAPLPAATPAPVATLSALPPAAYAAEVRKLLNRPEELEERVRVMFKRLASPVGVDSRLAMRPEDCSKVQKFLSEKFCVPIEAFGEIHQMFWRFEVTGHSRLYEDEATRMILCCLREYRDSISGPKATAQQLGQTIKTHSLADTHEVVRELGRGGQGIALLAKDKGSKQEVVVKMYSKTNQKGAAEEISQEFELLMTLKHPKIARVFDIFQDFDNVYIVQEPYFGGDLTTAVQNAYNAKVMVDERWVCEVMKQVLMGVEFLHNNNVIHADLKEPNVMVASTKDWRHPQVIVIDFGLANKFSAKSGVGGTPGYMPPEVWDFGLWTPRGDVFSIGVMMFTIRTGAGPFNPDGRKTLDEIKEATKTQEVVMDKGSPQLRSLVQTMMHKKFLQRKLISQVIKDPWFDIAEQGNSQELELQTLENLANQRQRTDLYRALLADVASKQNLAQLKGLNETFVKLDVNNDGKISANELRQGLKGVWKEADIERLVSVLGINSGGEVSYDEFMGELCAAKVPEENALLHRLFLEADVHGRGFLGEEELADLAGRPAIVQILGSQAAALSRLRAMDTSGTGRVTFEDFRRAVQGGAGDPPGGQTRYGKGQAVEYWSRTHGVWMACRVMDVDDARGAVMVDCKPDQWLAAGQVKAMLRPVGARQPPGYREGQSVEMYSTTYGAWIPCRVTRADPASGAVQVNQKPDYWFMGNELATRLRPAVAGAPDVRQNGMEAVNSAAKGGVGRQLLGAAFDEMGDQRGRASR